MSGGVFSRIRDWARIPAPSPEIALQIFNEKYSYLTERNWNMHVIYRKSD